MRWHEEMPHIRVLRNRLLDVDGANPSAFGEEKEDRALVEDTRRGANYEVDVKVVWVDEIMRELDSGAFAEVREVEGRNVICPAC